MDQNGDARSRQDYTIGWISVIETELVAARSVLDRIHPTLPAAPGDDNHYVYGSIGPHNVVIATLPSGTLGTSAAARVASRMKTSFPQLRIRLLVGIGGGVPSINADIRLGDVVVSHPNGNSPGVIQYDLGKVIEGQPRPLRTGTLNKPPEVIMAAVAGLRARHQLHQRSLSESIRDSISRQQQSLSQYNYPGSHKDCLYEDGRIMERMERSNQDPLVHYGTIASGNQVIKDCITRDYWRDHEKVLCFEMEAAGVIDDFPCLIIRGIADYADSHKNDVWQPYAALVAASYAKELILEIAPLENESLRKCVGETKAEDLDQRCESIISSLYFVQAEFREEDIEVAYSRTFEWLLQGTFNETRDKRGSGFVEWLRSDGEGLYWISGKAGSGKSTLMKKLALDDRLKANLQQWTRDEEVIIASFYFHDRGSSPLQKTRIGLLRSLIYQILRQRRTLTDIAFSHLLHHKDWCLGRDPMLSHEWTYRELMAAFRRLIQASSNVQNLYIHIDGLDEYTGSELENVGNEPSEYQNEALRMERKARGHTEIANLFMDAARYPHVKVCVSSRPLQRIYDTFEGVKSLQLEHLTSADIATYVTGTFEKHPLITRVSDPGGRGIRSLCQRIVSTASGVFLWVRLVVRTLIEGLQDRDTLSELEMKLESQPSDLGGPQGLFARMLKDIRVDHLSSFAQLARLVLHARSPPSTLLLSFAENATIEDVVSTPAANMTASEAEAQSEWMAERVRSRSNGFLEAKRHNEPRRISPDYPFYKQDSRKDLDPFPLVQFMHQTVKEFFREPSTWALLEAQEIKSPRKPIISKNLLADPDTALLCGYLKSLRAVGSVKGPNTIENIMTWETIMNALYYANKVEQRKGSADDTEPLLDELDRCASQLFQQKLYIDHRDAEFHTATNWSQTEPNDGRDFENVMKRIEAQENFLSLCIRAGLDFYVISKIIKDPDLVTRKPGRPLLHFALDKWKGTCRQSAFHMELHQDTLLKRVLDQRLVLWRSPYQANPVLIKSLLQLGADPNEDVDSDIATSGEYTAWLCALCQYGVVHRNAKPEYMPEEVDSNCQKWIDNIKLLIEFKADVQRVLSLRITEARTSLFYIMSSLCHLPKERLELASLLKIKGCRLTSVEVIILRDQWGVPNEELTQYIAAPGDPGYEPPSPALSALRYMWEEQLEREAYDDYLEWRYSDLRGEDASPASITTGYPNSWSGHSKNGDEEDYDSDEEDDESEADDDDDDEDDDDSYARRRKRRRMA